MLTISDEVIYKIAEKYNLSDPDADVLVDALREDLVSILWQSIFIYFEIHKSDAELKYVGELLKRMETDFVSSSKKLGELLGAEVETQPEFLAFVQDRIQRYLLKFLDTMLRSLNREDRISIAREIFPDLEILLTLLKDGKIKSNNVLQAS